MINSDDDKILIKQISANGLVFKCRTAGLGNGGEPIIFLHGFPESSIMWNRIMISLASQGYQCIAPDQRGYSVGARPKGKKNYAMDKVAADVIAIADAVNFEKFHLVGHDWGAGAGWTVVQLYPDRVNDWTALSIPHMLSFSNAKNNDPYQMERSKYMDKFQIPILPEISLKAKNYNHLRALWGFHPVEEIEDYLTILKPFIGRKSALAWYRGNKELVIDYGDVYIPTLYIWGNKDFAIGRVSVEGTKQYMKGEFKFVEVDAGHWLIQENYDVISKEIITHIKSHVIK
jgi:pimeloyl-ACP methyl ester carboxylesterase